MHPVRHGVGDREVTAHFPGLTSGRTNEEMINDFKEQFYLYVNVCCLNVECVWL